MADDTITDDSKALRGVGRKDNGAIGKALHVHAVNIAAPVLSNVAASASSVTIKAANTARRGLLVANDADKALMLKYGATASATSFVVKIAAGGYWEMPLPVYQGVVDGIWEAAPTGAARVTELS